MTSDLKDYSDREVALLMKESVKRMDSNTPLRRSEMRDLYDEYRSRSDDSRDSEKGRPYRSRGK